MNLFTENRQALKTSLLILFFAGICLPMSGQAQSEKTKIDYSKRSNILNPDTLQGDQKKIFWHPYFLKLSSEKTKNLDPFKVKEEFAKLGIETKERARFVAAYSFLDNYCWGHKKSCEQWESFKDLAPKSD
jgi:hypothetical protein